ncbi:MAG TPA: hypothetical protein VIM73_22010, partial [Polyangiaceae bacterium]
LRAMPSAGEREQPRGRGSAVEVVGRAWLEQSPNGPVSRDTGDMSRTARGAATTVALEDSSRYQELVRVAGESLGRALARRVLGLPEPTREAP